MAKQKMKQPGNHEWVIVIQGIDAHRRAIPPYFTINCQYHLFLDIRIANYQWIGWVMATSENSCIISECGFERIKHFHKYTKAGIIGHYCLLIPQWP